MFVKFLIHLTVLEILGILVVDMCFCLQTCISAVVMAVAIGQSLIDPLYNVLRSVRAHARNNFTRALNYAHPYGYNSAILSLIPPLFDCTTCCYIISQKYAPLVDILSMHKRMRTRTNYAAGVGAHAES